MLRKIDRHLSKMVGLPYLKLTRDPSIYDRCEYFLHRIRNVEPRKLRILDVGCGSGAILPFMAYEAPERVENYVGIDLRASRLRTRYQDIGVPNSFKDINLDSDWNVGSFDVAWCSECLEHITDDKGVFRKIVRSVNRGGLIIVSMPALAHRKRVGVYFPELLEVSSIQDGGHVRIGYDRASLMALAEGTATELIHCDGITKADLAYMRRRYRWSEAAQYLNNVINLVGRTDADRYALSDNHSIDYADYQSIGGVYLVK